MGTTKMTKIPNDRLAGEGLVWCCGACGKRSEDLYGLIGWHDRGWDESCMLNAYPIKDNRTINDKETKIQI